MLDENNIKSELSYAYLHAVASRVGIICEMTGRHLDNAAVDAKLYIRSHPMAADSELFDVDLEVQLKATSTSPREHDGSFVYSTLPVHQYNKLRMTSTDTQKILVVLFLPSDSSNWLVQSEEYLVSRTCAYWVSLRGARASDNDHTQTVHLPRANVFSEASLRDLFTRLSRREFVTYAR